MPQPRPLRVDTDGPLRRLRLDRPQKRNALSAELREQLADALDDAARDDRVGAVLLDATGDVFCAGFDLDEIARSGDPAAVFADARHYHHRVHTFPKPLIAAIDGPAVAGGFDLALLCDLRFASTRARFGQPQVRHGLPASYELLAHVLGVSTARDLCLRGHMVDATEALALRIVSEVTEPDDLSDRAQLIARAIAESPGAQRAKAQFVAHQPPLFAPDVTA